MNNTSKVKNYRYYVFLGLIQSRVFLNFRRILSVSSADEFYSLMGVLTQDMMAGKMFTADSLIKVSSTDNCFLLTIF